MTTQSMQTILRGDIVGAGRAPGHAAQRAAGPSAMDVAIVDSVFEKLQILFPVGAPKADTVGTHKAEWLKTMAAQGVRSREQVQYGLNRARREVGDRQFWPTPRQFCLWCVPLPEDTGLPAVASAYREALKHYHSPDKHKWSHVIVRLAARETTAWLFKNGKEKEVFDTFERNYAVLTRRFLDGEPLDVAVPAALPQGGSIPTPPDRAKKTISNLRRSLGLRGGHES